MIREQFPQFPLGLHREEKYIPRLRVSTISRARRNVVNLVDNLKPWGPAGLGIASGAAMSIESLPFPIRVAGGLVFLGGSVYRLR